jgi:membrane associated rhomboid family serine protease
MSIASTTDGRSPASRLRIWIGIVLLVLGLIGHLYAAYAMGGSRVAYSHHVFGFFLILVVTGAIIAAVGWRFWRSRPDITVLTVGAVQAVFGVLVAVDQIRAAVGG